METHLSKPSSVPPSPGRLRFRDRFWLATNDPGGWNFLRTLRATLASLLACGIMLLLYSFIAPGYKLPIATFVFTLVITLLSTQIIFNNVHQQQKRTLLLVIPLVALSQLAALVSTLTWLANLLLLGCIFAAFYLRRFGVRFGMLGLIGFYCYYLPLNKQVTPDQLPLLLVASCVSIFCAYSLRFLIFPPCPHHALVRSLDTFYLRLLVVLGSVMQSCGGGSQPKQPIRAVRTEFKRLRICLQKLHLQLKLSNLHDRVSQATLDQIDLAMYQTVLAIETLEPSLRALTTSDPQERKQLFSVLQRIIEYLPSPEDATMAKELEGRIDRSMGAVRTAIVMRGDTQKGCKLFRAIDACARLLTSTRSFRQVYQQIVEQQHINIVAARRVPYVAAKTPEAVPKPAALRPTTQLAIRALIACSICLLVGSVISPEHPYWTMIAAGMVTATTAGITRKKAFARAAMTLLAACASFVLVGLCSSFAAGTVVLIVSLVISLFMMMYVLSPAPTYMAFWVVMFIALADGLSGGLTKTTDVILNRSLDTLLGCFIAAVVLLMVFPIRKAGMSFLPALVRFTSILSAVISRNISLFEGRIAREGQQEYLHLLDAQVQMLKQSAEQASYEVSLFHADRSPIARQMIQVLVLAQTAKQMTGLITQHQLQTADAECIQIMDTLQKRAQGVIDVLNDPSKRDNPISVLPDVAGVVQRIVAQKKNQSLHTSSLDDPTLFWLIMLCLLMDSALGELAFEGRGD